MGSRNADAGGRLRGRIADRDRAFVSTLDDLDRIRFGGVSPWTGHFLLRRCARWRQCLRDACFLHTLAHAGLQFWGTFLAV